MPTPRKTDADHRLQGTKSQAKDEGSAFVPGRPKFPKGLPQAARSVFKRLAGLLEKRRHLTEGDVELLRIYSLLYVRHAKALQEIEADGEICVYVRMDSNGQPHDQYKPNLWLKVAETCEKNMVAALDRLGLTPANRAKVKPTGDDKNKPADPMEEFLARSPGSATAEAEDDDLEGLVN